MTNCEAKAFIEEHIMWGEYTIGEYGKALKKAIKALEQQNDDCISRKEAIRIAEQGQVQGYPWQIAELSKLQSVQPEPKTGHWIEDDITERSKSAYKHKCDRCGAYHRAMYDYCPSCGAKMFEPQERSE